MRGFKYVLLAAALFMLFTAAPKSRAQVSIGIGVGEPACPYGYYGYGSYQEHPDHFQSFQASHYSDVHGHYHTEAQHGSYVHH